MTLALRVKNDLEAMGRGALKLRGQHFLIEEKVLDRIVETSGVVKGDRVLEIGPGLGFLTERLLAHGCEVVAIELDPAFADHIEHHFGSRAHVVRADALETDFAKLFNGKDFHIVANIPYNISAKLLEKIVTSGHVATATLLVQKEVAERVAAKPGEMNMLALMVQTKFSAEVGFTVPAGAFLPPPKVQSAVLKLTRSLGPESSSGQAFGMTTEKGMTAKTLALAKRAFSSPRKKISTTLKLSKEVFVKAQLTGDERPAEINLETWKILAE